MSPVALAIARTGTPCNLGRIFADEDLWCRQLAGGRLEGPAVLGVPVLGLRSLAAGFTPARRARALGHAETQTIAGKDVTADYIDLAARLHIAKARRLVLLRLMHEANTIEQTIRVQNALDAADRGSPGRDQRARGPHLLRDDPARPA